MFLVGIYELDRAYGGPEEGGWWYDTGELKKVVAASRNEECAYAKSRRLNGWLDRLQRGKRDVSSVIYGGGRFGVMVFEDRAPIYYPEQRPHYE